MEKWRKNLYILTGVQFIVRVAVQIFIPFLPIYIFELGIENIESIAMWTGAIASINHLFAAIASPFWGTMADKYGRKPMVIRSILSLCVAFYLMSFSKTVYFLFAMRLLMGLFSGYSAAIVSLVGSNVPENEIGKAMGLIQGGQIAGTVIGPLVGGFLSEYISFKKVLQLSSLLCLLGCIFVLIFVTEEFVKKANSSVTNIFVGLKKILDYNWLFPIILLVFVARLSLKIVEPIITLVIKSIAESEENITSLSGIIFSLTGIANIVGLMTVSKISDRIGYYKIIIFSLFISSGIYILQAFVNTPLQLAIVRICLGISSASIIPIANALIGKLTPKEERGSVYGIIASATFLGSFAGPLCGGILTSLFGVKSVFFFTAVLMVVNAVIFIFAKDNYKLNT